jgi:uncharacterized protein
MHGLHPTKGDFLWSAPPRERPMMYIIEDTAGTNDVLYPRCSAFLYEYHYGLPVHTNCHDIQAEAQREYGLTPDDVHDSFNFFMHTGIDRAGRPFIGRQMAKKGDYVDLLALSTCSRCRMSVVRTWWQPAISHSSPSRFFEPSDEALAAVPKFFHIGTQRTPADFKIKTIKADRALRRDPNYLPEFTNVPIRTTEVAVTLDAEEAQALEVLKATGRYGGTDAEVLRYVLFSWWIERFMKGPKHFDDLKS